jgi:flagellar biosynthesis protein FlhG
MVANNPLYRGTMESRVVAVNRTSMIVTMPSRDGKPVFLPVGTIVRVQRGDAALEPPFQAEVLAREFKPVALLTITLPQAISRGGRSEPGGRGTRVIAVTSGKGGVGKTTLAINLAIALSRLQLRICLIDVDLGTANVDFLLRLNASYNLSHLLKGEKELKDIIVEGPEGLRIIPGAVGLADLANLSDWQYTRLIHAFNQLEQECDLLILDTGAGIAANVTNFLVAADTVLVVTTPDPHAILDAYALIKTLCSLKQNPNIKLIINRVESYEEENQVKRNLLNSCRSFLQQPIEYLGWVTESAHVTRSIRDITPFVISYPRSEAALCVAAIARKLAAVKPEAEREKEKGLRRFIDDLFGLLKKSALP